MFQTKIHRTLLSVILLVASVSPVIARNIDVNDDGHQYAWGENIGWINFNPSYGEGITLSATNLTGDACGENVGWIRMNPAYGGVVHNGNGTLSGYAWGENIGWISFSCENTDDCESVDYGVTVDPNSGILSGKAWSENTGWIVFDYNNSDTYGVKAFWGFCAGDFDSDGDIDGLDLSAFITKFDNGELSGNNLITFTGNFGITDCSSYVGPAEVLPQTVSVVTTDSLDTLESTSSNSLGLSQSDYSVTTASTTEAVDSLEDEVDPLTQEMTLTAIGIDQVIWANSNGLQGVATEEWVWEWKIDEITLDLGTNLLNVVVTDLNGNIAEKEIQIVYNKILTEEGEDLPEKWVRKLIYKFKFDDSDLEETTTVADVTVWLWPDEIIMTDDYASSDTIEIDRMTTEDGFQYHWSMKCNASNNKILYLDLPLEAY